MRRRWAEERPEALAGAIRALLRAAKFCDEPENAAYTAALLSRPHYLGVDSHAILAALPGGTKPDNGCVFFRGATNFPWRSQGLWFLGEMRRWGLIDASIDLRALAEQVYQPDIYRAAVASLGEPVPLMDWKHEGAHDAPWTAETAFGPIAMAADRFCDGAIFDPDALPSPAAMHSESA